MRRLHLLWAGAITVAAVAALTNYTSAQGQAGADVKALYDRSESFGRRTNNLLYNVVDNQTWVDGSARLSYRKSVKGGYEFMLADIAAGTKAPAFDHAKLAAAIPPPATGSYTAITLPFQNFTYLENRTSIEFTLGGGGGGGGRQGGGGGGGRQGGGAPAAGTPTPVRYRCTLTTYECTRQAASDPTQGGGGANQGRGGRQGGGATATAGGARMGGAAFPAAEENVKNQPGLGCWQAVINNYNVYLRPQPATTAPAGCRGQQLTPFMLSTDGSEGNYYSYGSMNWSPDGKKMVAVRTRPGYTRLVHFVESSPADQVQPKHTTMSYQKPGDARDLTVPVVFDVATKKMVSTDTSLFSNPYQNSGPQWRSDSRAVTFEYNQRGHQIYRVIEIDANTGKTRALIEEAPKTFVEYSGKKYRLDMNDGKEIIWASERDGWNHLYLYDGVTGQVKNQITKGQWVVRGVVRVDQPNRQIWFNASGMHAGKDPYLLHHYRVNFDGTGLTAFTSEDGSHAGFAADNNGRGQNFSPDGQFYIDSWSRVDLPPQTVIKRTSDQKTVIELEKGDITELLKTGWTTPEVFTSKARDGQTDIWGIIIKPTNFDPTKKYPVIENIYAGPQGSFVPKVFSTQGGMNGLAEFGFIVIQVDGMGTSNRSKAFHDVAWQNLGDAGFPDRILWHKAIAAKYPWYDITRVGIYGTSAGGQNSLGGLLFHPDFYDVAVTNSGCHDNRMDKIWWNEQWMGWPIGPHYGSSSNVDNASKLRGKVQLVVPELDTNVDPASTMQVVNALVRASKEFELVVIPGANHGAGSPITARKRNDFFVRHLLGLTTPDWNAVPLSTTTTGDDDEPDYVAMERAWFGIDRER